MYKQATLTSEISLHKVELQQAQDRLVRNSSWVIEIIWGLCPRVLFMCLAHLVQDNSTVKRNSQIWKRIAKKWTRPKKINSATSKWATESWAAIPGRTSGSEFHCVHCKIWGTLLLLVFLRLIYSGAKFRNTKSIVLLMKVLTFQFSNMLFSAPVHWLYISVGKKSNWSFPADRYSKRW